MKSVMEARVHAVPIERVYDEACEAKNQALEPTAYEVPIHLKHTDMVCVYIRYMVCACDVCRVCLTSQQWVNPCCCYPSLFQFTLHSFHDSLITYGSHHAWCCVFDFILCGCYLIPSVSLIKLCWSSHVCHRGSVSVPNSSIDTIPTLTEAHWC